MNIPARGTPGEGTGPTSCRPGPLTRRFGFEGERRWLPTSDKTLARILAFALPLFSYAISEGADGKPQLPPAANRTIDFAKDIQPILESSCLRCHGATKPKSGFRLDNRIDAVKGGDNGVALVPGDSAKSALIRYVAHLEPDLEMPPVGKGDKLSAEKIGLLRTWIDQGAKWAEPIATAKLSFSVKPTIRYLSVSGNEQRFREHTGLRENASGGAAEFSLRQQMDRDTELRVDGHALIGEENYKVEMSLTRRDVGFVRGGFEQWRRYYDDLGGYYSPYATPSFALGRELELDVGKAWIDFGLTLPDWPELIFGYEFQYKDGTKSMLTWGPSSALPITRNIYPSFKDIDEQVHIFKFDLRHDWNGTLIEDEFRAELHDLKTRHTHGSFEFDTLGPTPVPLERLREQTDQFIGANTLRLERQIRDGWFASAGYHYSRLAADVAIDLRTETPAGATASGFQWVANGITHDAETHAFSVSSLFGPWSDLTISPSVQSEWHRRRSFGGADLQFVPFFGPLTPVPVALSSSYDEHITTEAIALRYTGFTNFVLHGEARLTQEDLGIFEQQVGGLGAFPVKSPGYLQRSNGDVDDKQFQAGIRYAPTARLSLATEYQRREKNTGYVDEIAAVTAPWALPGFIRWHEQMTDEISARITARLQRWWRMQLDYRLVSGEYVVATDTFAGATPGGAIFSSDSDTHTISLGNSFQLNHRLQLSATASFSDSRTVSAQNGVAAVAPWRGRSFNANGQINYALNEKTDWQCSYHFAQAEFGQSNLAAGLPAGTDYRSHALQTGITRRLKRDITARLQYALFLYDEPTGGGFSDYTAHGIFATIQLAWPKPPGDSLRVTDFKTNQ